MKKKALVLASCVAFATPTISIAQALPDNSVGLNLGDISASSYLDQPFRGVIPFLFTSVESTRQLSVRLAPQSVFEQIGAEKLPILNDLQFYITSKSNKPVIQISSNTPIQLPFLNFVLEIEGPSGVLYQDYTVLLDPQGYKPGSQTIQQQPTLFEISDKTTRGVTGTSSSDVIYPTSEKEVSNNDLPITYSSTSVVTNQAKNYKIKSGDSLSRIAKRYKPNDISLKKMMRIIFDKNPKAFIRGDIDKIKRGVVLNLPTHIELTGLDNIAQKVEFKDTTPKVADFSLAKNQYKVVKGDSLSKITTKFIDKNTSFTKMMNAIFTANPEAFAKNNKSQLKAGATLRIPSFEEIASPTPEVASIKTTTAKTPNITTVAITSKQVNVEPKTIITAAAQSDNAKNIEETNVTKELPLQQLSMSTSNQKPDDKTKTTALEPNEYRVKEGDTLIKITKEIGYENVSFTKMMKAIYSENIHAFEKNNITKLKVGAVLSLPKLSDLNGAIANANSTKTNDVKTQKLAEKNTNKTTNEIIEKSAETNVVDTPTKQPIESVTTSEETNTETSAQKNSETIVSPISALDTTDLEKRIRELRSELDQAKSGLVKMESELTTKDALIFEKDNELVDLRSSLIKLKINRTSEQNLENDELAPEDVIVEDELYVESPAATSARIAALKLLKQSSEDKSKQGFNHMLSSAVKEYYDNASPKSLAYLSMALILGWLLIRYRRQIYSYTAINFDEPKYYPAPGIDEYELKERNITHQEPITEKDAAEEYFENIKNETKSELYHEPVNEFGEESESLVEKSELVDEISELVVEESEEIEHCEHLVTELFSDLNSSSSSKTEVSIGDNEWLSIEKICDDYIEKKSENNLDPADEYNVEQSEISNSTDQKDVADFDEMMSDLLKSLDGVEKSIHNSSSLKRNNRHSHIDPTEEIS